MNASLLRRCCAFLAIAAWVSGQDGPAAPVPNPESKPPRPVIIPEESPAPPKPTIVPEESPAPLKPEVTPEPPPPPVPVPTSEVRRARVVTEEPKPSEAPKATADEGKMPSDKSEKAGKDEAKKPTPKEEDAPLKAKAVSLEDLKAPEGPKEIKPQIPISDRNDRNARALFLSIPAPRGQIVDRHGNPLAQNRMAYFLGVQFNLSADTPDDDVLRYARIRVAYIQKHCPDGWEVKDTKILDHFKNRRWLPLLATRPVPAEPTDEVRKALPPGVVLVPAYLRSYPHGVTACHVLGELGRVGDMPSGPIQNGDQIWPFTEGRSGLEAKFEKDLAGTPGRVNLVFSATGEKIAEEIVEHPRPGNTLVTSLDLFMQQTVERVLSERTRRGAMVIMDVQTGDVLALASNPEYDPNLFTFGVRDRDYKPLLDDPDKPLLCRAMNAGYPPASTFKVITALAALESGKVSGETYYECVASLFIGDRYFKNWHHEGEGPMNVVDAIKRSCNTWFYKAAITTGAGAVTSMAQQFGLGSKTGLCLPEMAGRVPTPEWWRKERNSNITQGDLANISIGQGDTLVTPLQDCAMMAGIARGHSVPVARLVQHIQNLDGGIEVFFAPEKKSELHLSGENIGLVRAGMKAVVEEGDGTGKAAGNSYVQVAGKTGTAQWTRRNGEWVHMAWFAGYVPAKDPQYAFAAVYEGDPGEDSISGGKKVAPIIGRVFERIYEHKKENGDSMSGPPETNANGEVVRRARPVEESGEKKKEQPAVAAPEPEPVVEQAPQREGGLRWLWKKLRGKQ